MLVNESKEENIRDGWVDWCDVVRWTEFCVLVGGSVGLDGVANGVSTLSSYTSLNSM